MTTFIERTFSPAIARHLQEEGFCPAMARVLAARGIETVEAPEGYEIVGENTYAVDVTEDDLLNLVADPTEVTFTVKPVATTPGNPENPTDDGTTTPTQDGTMGGNPTTGDATPYVILAVTVAAAAGVMVVAFKRRKA